MADTAQAAPFKVRLSYYFNHGKPYRWIEMDSLGFTTTDCIYKYDENWQPTAVMFKRAGEKEFSRKKVSSTNDATKVMEEVGAMEKVDDRSFQYPSDDENGDWSVRKKMKNGIPVKIQKRQLVYDAPWIAENGQFYEGIISTKEWDENSISFNEEEDIAFFTRGKDWQKQLGYLAVKKDGIFVEPQHLTIMDTIYNGSISPSGNKIIYCKRKPESQEIWLIEKRGGQWLTPSRLTVSSGIDGSYFNWLDDRELYFYTTQNNGDLVKGQLLDGELKITDSLSVLNTNEGTEFSPYIDKQKRFVVFTRYNEKDTAQQGVFISYNQGNFAQTQWGKPQKMNSLPYCWGAYFSKGMKYFFYTDGEDIFKISAARLNLKLE
ncbi:MAG: hypothetical protein AAF985_07235 [Bacteroidota bacterium]